MISSLRFLAVAALGLLASTSVDAATTHHSSGHPQHWVQSSRAAAETPVKLVLAIKQKNTELLHELLDAVSNPESPMYGKHLSFEEVHEMTGQPMAADAVMKYIEQHVNPLFMEATVGGDFVKLAVRVGDAEKLLSTQYHSYTAQDDASRRIIRAKKYTIPDAIEQHVDFVGYANHFPSTLKSMFSSVGDANGNTVPSTINTAYTIDSNTVTNAKSTCGVFEDGQDFDPADLTAFEALYSLPTEAVATIIGTNDPTQCSSNPDNCGEASLDVQYLIAVAQGAPLTFYAANTSDQQPFLDWLIALDGDATAPWVNSVSYGEPELGVPADTLARFETEMAKLGVRGITVMVSSGDDGVAGPGLRSDPTVCTPATGTYFSASYPASSALVTAVGATQGPEASPASTEVGESSATGGLITSGGGFSPTWSTPTWQADAVKSFLANNATGLLPPLTMFASTGRGYPDVAILGHNYAVLIANQTEIVSGTSASAPVFAAMITLINSVRMDAGKAPLGFLNPALYSLAASDPTIFQDVTAGENNCAAAQSSPNCCQYGFSAVAGWDAMTGLGSVNFTKLKAALLALP